MAQTPEEKREFQTLLFEVCHVRNPDEDLTREQKNAGRVFFSELAKIEATFEAENLKIKDLRDRAEDYYRHDMDRLQLLYEFTEDAIKKARCTAFTRSTDANFKRHELDAIIKCLDGLKNIFLNVIPQDEGEK